MTLVPILGFAALALAAIALASFALWRRGGEDAPAPDRARKGRLLLSGAVALFLIGVGGGSYWMVGQPGLALRAAEGLSTHDIRGLVPYLIQRVRKTPNDLQAWVFLGRAYVTVGDADQAAKAFAQAVALANAAKTPVPGLQSAYGEALTAAAGNVVSDPAAAAFTAALAENPKDAAARFFLGQARAQKGDRAGALALWNGLLAETPDTTPLHQILVDRIAMLSAAGGAAPDPRQMVAQLAARLAKTPKDAAGWQRLIRAYAVLGETDKARAALTTARKTFAGDKQALAALDDQARDLKLP